MSEPVRKRRGPDLRRVNELSKRFVYRMSTLVRTAQLYDMNNQAMEYSLRVASATATQLSEALGEVTLLGIDETVHVNELRIKVARGMTSTIVFLNEYMRTRGLGGIIVNGSTEPDEWRKVVSILTTTEEVDEEIDASPSCNMRLSDVEIEHIRFASPLALRKGTLGSMFGGEGDSVHVELTRALQVYVRTVRAVAAMHQRFKHGKSHHGLSRIVQHLVELSFDSPRHHLALTSVKDDLEFEIRHPVNTAILAIALGQRINLGRGALLDLGLAALTCDIGTQRLPPELRDRGEDDIDEEDRHLYERHPLDSVLTTLQGGRLDLATRRRLLVSFEHHLGLDHGGFPKVYRWGELHLFSRLVAVCELYDRLTTQTEHRDAMLPDEALNRLVELAGLRLDPALVSSFVNMLGRLPLGATVMLTSGEVGVVYMTHPDPKDAARPMVKLLLDPQGRPFARPELVDLRDRDPRGAWSRVISRTVDPRALGIDVKRALYS